MGREIKFRVWRSHSKSMEIVTLLMWGDVVTFGKITQISSEVTDLQPDLVTLMQFTGLFDKNGTEIYEGDRLSAIIPSHLNVSAAGKLKEVVVRWENEQGGFLVEWEYSKNQHYVNLTCDAAHCTEVIGNIYEK